VFWLVPVVHGFSIGLGLGEGRLDPRAYASLLTDGRYHRALANTVIYTAATIAIVVPASTALAHLIRSSLRPLRGPCSFALLLPALTPPSVLAILFYMLFAGKHGILNNAILGPLGLPAVDWMNDPRAIMPALVIQGVWRWTGLVTFFVLAGLDGIPAAYLEMARIDGAGAWRAFRDVTLPLLRHVLAFATVYLLVDGFSAFAGAYVLLGRSGGPLDAGLLLVSYVHQVNFAPYDDPARAAAIGFSVVPPLAALVWLLLMRRPRGLAREMPA
jgi:ABC-type sugar transport system permease subunit